MVTPNKLKADWQKEDEHFIDSSIDALLKARNGRQFLWWLLEIGKVGMQPYSGNALNTAFGCGELNVGQRILDRIITVSPDGYVNMMKEQQDNARSRAKSLADAGAKSRAEPDSDARTELDE